VAALAAGYYAAPRFWVVLPVQAIVLSLGASFGLHWGSHARADETRDAAPDAGPPPLAPAPETTAGIATPICPDA
jgi:hypothetical protein